MLSEAHLRQVLKCYARYHNETRTHLAWTRMRPFLARFSEPVWSGHLASWVDFITTTPELQFSVHSVTMQSCHDGRGVCREVDGGAPHLSHRLAAQEVGLPHRQQTSTRTGRKSMSKKLLRVVNRLFAVNAQVAGEF